MATEESPLQLVTRQTKFPLETTGDTRAPHILAIVGFLTGLSALLIVLRGYVRLYILRRFDIEDGVIIAALLCAFGVLACFVGESFHGLGHYSDDIAMADFGVLNEWMFYHAIVIVLGISLVKVSLGFFLLRFAARKRALRWFIIGCLIFLVLFTIACILTLVLQCFPIQAAWNFALRRTAKCYSTKTYLAIAEFNSAINIATDVVFATLPVFMFYNIQVNRWTKISLMGILSLGYFACAAAIVKAVLQSRIFKEPDSFRECNYLIWNCAELNIGIVAASFPTIKPLMKRVLGSTLNLTGGASGSRYGKRSATISSSQPLHSLKRSRADHDYHEHLVDDMQMQNNIINNNDNNNYSVRVASDQDKGASGSAYSLDGSEEGLDPRPRPRPDPHSYHYRHQFPARSEILRTTEVIVQREDSPDWDRDGNVGRI
ncbi:hypothetical protein P168DRAFT_315906 [Aspergillus campestris IBT 28561]|uniref:Rhodopsin domain-containing protein n=1 Tax=Aspergillus campestris (strain IBT 28561) TaxID=1392248 RepID=A0A2I1DBZ3_ASPC2|nr:uncharacterized protein P168DRAFT_315906 [Aspergillus campestris IBT 28561]PKY07396.1 hypothetical protein P168DRAFT_315906 [Aspergillus campestris IBT 28561]